MSFKAILILLAPVQILFAQKANTEVHAALTGFLTAFSARDFARFLPYIAEDATMFFPTNGGFPAERIQGRAAIEHTFKTRFDQNPLPAGEVPRPIVPQGLLIQEFERWAVATFHLGSGSLRGRRTFVLKQVNRDWKIVHLHASTSGRQP